MSAEPNREAAKQAGQGWLQIVFETIGVLVAGSLLALAANALSPRGLSLSRDYFPKLVPGPTIASTESSNAPGTATFTSGASGTNSASPINTVLARLRARGLQVVELAEVVALLKDPRTAEDRIVFVDARNDHDYQAGHIPGAFQVDYYHFEQYLPAALPALQNAEQVIVYCAGGDCEDSERTAGDLLAKFLSREKLFVYPGGFTEWSAHGEPVEHGARRSGQLKGGNP